MTKSPRCFRTVLGTVVVLLLAAPAIHAQSSTPAANPAYSAEFDAARAQATSDFEQSVLNDDIITKTEYDEAVQRFVTCLQTMGAGTELTVDADPLIPGAVIYRGSIAPNVPPEIRTRITEECATGTTAILEPLFIAIIVNPANADADALTLNCLRVHGLVASLQELPALREAADSATARINPSRSSTSPDAATVSCFANPGQTGLPTADGASTLVSATPITTPIA